MNKGTTSSSSSSDDGDNPKKQILEAALSYSIQGLASNNIAPPAVTDFDAFFGVIGNAVRISGTQTSSTSDDYFYDTNNYGTASKSTTTTLLDFIEEQTIIVPQTDDQMPIFLVSGVYTNVMLQDEYGTTWQGTISYQGVTRGTMGEFAVVGGTQDFVGVQGTIITAVAISTMMAQDSVVRVILDLRI